MTTASTGSGRLARALVSQVAVWNLDVMQAMQVALFQVVGAAVTVRRVEADLPEELPRAGSAHPVTP